jgi:hypothetical protein
MEQRSLFGLSEHLERLSKIGHPLEVLEATVDFEYFRGWLVEGLGYGDGAKDGRPPFDPVSMFKALILQAQHNLSDARMEFMIRDRLSWMRFLGFDLGGRRLTRTRSACSARAGRPVDACSDCGHGGFGNRNMDSTIQSPSAEQQAQPCQPVGEAG